jgi:hypothetical protein
MINRKNSKNKAGNIPSDTNIYLFIDPHESRVMTKNKFIMKIN